MGRLGRVPGLTGALTAIALLAGACAPADVPTADSSPLTVTGTGPVNAIEHGVAGPLSFTLPAGWSVTNVGHPKHYETVLAFVASPAASASESCGPDYVPGMGSGCVDAYSLPAGSVVIRLSEWQLPPRGPNGAADEIAADVAGGAKITTVANQSAAFFDPYADGDTPKDGTTIAWFVAGPGKGSLRTYALVVTMTSDDAATRETVQAIVDSLRIAPGN